MIISPFTYLETEKQKYVSIEKIANQTVVLCQAGLTDSMAEKILDDFDMCGLINTDFIDSLFYKRGFEND